MIFFAFKPLIYKNYNYSTKKLLLQIQYKSHFLIRFVHTLEEKQKIYLKYYFYQIKAAIISPLP
jgi:hypothetical protein